jgi:hypothetical protein
MPWDSELLEVKTSLGVKPELGLDKPERDVDCEWKLEQLHWARATQAWGSSSGFRGGYP